MSYISKSSKVIFICITFIAILVLTGCSTDETNAIGYDIKDAESDQFYQGLSPSRDYLVLVNDRYEYDFSGEYNIGLLSDLIYVSDSEGSLTPIEKGTNAAFSLLKQCLRAEYNIDIELYSGYRTREDQQWVYDYYSNLEGWSETNKIAQPGFSEHHTGLLLNIVIWWPSEDNPDEYLWTTETAERQASDPGYRVIRDNLADFGFIERYPAGKEHITGYPCEPYEIRFVGSSKIAHEIMDNNLCLEEYLDNLGIISK